VRFSQSGNILKFPARYLDAPIVQTEETLKDFLRTAPYQLVSTRSENENDALTAKVRQCLAEDLHQECPGIEDIATRLHVSSRTIHRKLQKEGTSFQKLKDQVRQEAAINYLARPELTVNAIAMLMGFHDTSAFYRAFKKWTGQSPGEYRKKHQ
jgi:AraC-like DNA-binding protein